MGIETDADYDGANCSFTSAIITIEGNLYKVYKLYKKKLLKLGIKYRTRQGRSFYQCYLWCSSK